jgi:ferredoxin--NADP+ reductase
MGAKSKSVLMLESQMRVVCDELFITTNDGSYERKGLATGILSELMNRYQVKAVYAIGGAEMMKSASQHALQAQIPIWVTINTYMTNGLGHCGSCRFKWGGKMMLSCVDGPHFDGTLVDYNDIALRYQQMEKECKIQIKPTSLWGYLTQSLGLTKKQV